MFVMNEIASHRPKRQTRRDEILLYMAEFITDHHNAPSSHEIARHFGLAQQTVYNHLMRLIAEGRVVRVDGRLKLSGAEYFAPTVI